MWNALQPYREDQLKVGMAMEVVFEEVAPGLTLPLFRPAQSAQ